MSIGAAPNKTGAKLGLRFRSSDLKQSTSDAPSLVWAGSEPSFD
jgi:hypothetical protein